jgi:hypothetical protein
MKSKFWQKVFALRQVAFASLMLLSGFICSAQTIIALPSNGSFSQESAPQGGLRYQRKFYLITANELNSSGLTASILHSIGFTYAVAQDSVTSGQFKFYLQNTTDTVSRIDTSWIYVSSTTNFYKATGLFAGNYEWQITPACLTSSIDTASAQFSTDDNSPCKRPTSFKTDSITASSAVLSWVAPVSSVSKYVVQYSAIDVINWITDTVTTNYYKVQGLTAGKYYQWRVQTLCSGNLFSASSSTDAAFATTGSCIPPSVLTTGSITDTSAAVAWSAASGATFYSIQYRRLGTTSWFGTSTSATAFAIKPLLSGTTYEWQVATVCTTGTGAYKAGLPFTTTGTSKCYAPGNLSVDSISTSSAKLTWSAQSNTSLYNIRYRLKQSISWANALSGMDTVNVVKDSITIPNVTGSFNIAFNAADSFAYTGGGLYVAWEYTNDSGKISSFNKALSNSHKTPILSFSEKNSVSDTSHLPVLTSTDVRPETLLGSSSFVDVAEVSEVYALGYNASPFSNPTPVSALIKNNSASVKTFAVSLTIKSGATAPYTATQNVTVNAGSSGVVSFNNISRTVRGVDSIIVSIPVQTNENVVNNNSNYYLQTNNNTIVAYADNGPSITSAGLDTLSGLLLTKYKMNGSGKVNSAQVYLTSSAKMQSVYAVLLNDSAHIIATSPAFTPDSTQVNAYHSFYFRTKAILKDTNYYIGLAQTATNPGYFPVGVQYEANVRSGAYYRADLDGGNLKDSGNKGRLMILAEIIPAIDAPVIVGRTSLCAGATDSLFLTSRSVRYADSVVAFSSQRSATDFNASHLLGAPDVYPDYGPNPNAWLSNTADGSREYIELKFFNPAPINYIDIFETYNLGAVDTVFLKNPSTGNYESVYSSTAASKNTSPAAARINRITFPTTGYNVSEIRLAINSPAVSGFNAIDAVGIGLISNPPTFTSISWLPGGATTSTIHISSSGIYKVTVSNADACVASDSITVTTPGSITPSITPAGPLNFCIGDSIKLTSSQVYGNTWSTGDTTRSIIVKISGSDSLTYFDGCGNRQSNTVRVTVNPLPVVTIAGVRFICSGHSTTLHAGSGYSSYSWSTGAATQTITVSSQGVYSVTVINSNGCSASASVNVTLAQSPTPVITGNPGFCPGSTTTLNAGTGYAAYLWSTTALTNSITVNSVGSYSVVVTDNNGCTGGASVLINGFTPPTPVISGTLSFCAGNSTILDAGTGYASYLWSTGEINHSITATAVQTYSVTVTDNNGCTGSTSVSTTTQSSIPATPGPITGATANVCNSTQAYSIEPVTNSSRYVWTLPNGSIIDTPSTSISVIFGSGFSSGNITVAAANNCGQSSSLNPRTLTVKAQPVTPGSISGMITGVCGKTSVTYTISPVTGAASYTWVLPTGATIASGLSNTNSITVNFITSFVSGNICVTANNPCGSSTASCLTVSGKPILNGSISGPTTVCSKQANVVYSIAAASGATSYTWTVPSLAVISSGQGTNTITVKFSTKGGSITVKANSSCGASDIRSLTVVNGTCTSKARQSNTNEVNDMQGLAARILPNPSSTYFTLVTHSINIEPMTVRVIDAVGRIVWNQINSPANGTLSFGDQLKPGMYFVEISQGKKRLMIRLLKMPNNNW